MIRHIVCWKLKDVAEGRSKAENAMLIKAKLEALVLEIQAIKALDIGIDPGTSEGNWDIVLDSDFKTYEDLQVYQVHPAHIAFQKFISPLRELKSCVDFEV